MLTFDLARLDRERGPVHVREVVPAEAALFEDADLQLEDGLEVEADIKALSSGEIVVRGRISGKLDRACRRCLEPMAVRLEAELDLLFVPEDETAPDGEEEDEQVLTFDAAAGVLELGEAVRAEAILANPRFVECSEDCEGLCPVCGTNLNEDTCDCTRSEPDPRWDKLRALKEERE